MRLSSRHACVYKNLGNGKFKDVSKQAGPGVTEQFSSRGCAFGDYDNDGDMDVLVLNMNDRFSLLRNDGGNKNNWIKIKLIGTQCNRTAIGARARVVNGETRPNRRGPLRNLRDVAERSAPAFRPGRRESDR